MKSKQNLHSPRYSTETAAPETSRSDAPTTAAAAADIISRPSHYVGRGNLEAITVIRAFGLDESFELGSATKYLLRSGSKGSKVENIRKARQMIDMWLTEHEEE